MRVYSRVFLWSCEDNSGIVPQCVDLNTWNHRRVCVCVSQLCDLCRYGAVTEQPETADRWGRREASAESMSTAPASRFPLDAQVLYIVVRQCHEEGGGNQQPWRSTQKVEPDYVALYLYTVNFSCEVHSHLL